MQNTTSRLASGTTVEPVHAPLLLARFGRPMGAPRDDYQPRHAMPSPWFRPATAGGGAR